MKFSIRNLFFVGAVALAAGMSANESADYSCSYDNYLAFEIRHYGHGESVERQRLAPGKLRAHAPQRRWLRPDRRTG